MGHNIAGRQEPFKVASAFCVQIDADTVRCEARLGGTLDATTTQCLERVLDQLLRAGHTHVVLDFAEVDLVAAAGLRVLVRADADLRAAGGQLELTNLPRIVRRVLAITALDETLALS